MIRYDEVARAVEGVGMVARGGFVTTDADIPSADGKPTRCVVIIGNIGSTMWPHYLASQPSPEVSDPLDTWTRAVLGPIAARFGAAFVHPSDEPFQPFQRWAQLADDVWQSPIGLLIHPEYGLWHAYRGAMLFVEPVDGLPPTGQHDNPCDNCATQPCLSTCPVGAFTASGYDHVACRGHVGGPDSPDCLHTGCAARLACPVNPEGAYRPDQMLFHMQAFVGH